MRLIDADKLIEDYTQPFADSYGKSCAEMFVGVVKQTPTVDIIEELEKIKKEFENREGVFTSYHFVKAIDSHITELKGEQNG